MWPNLSGTDNRVFNNSWAKLEESLFKGCFSIRSEWRWTQKSCVYLSRDEPSTHFPTER